VLGKEDDDWVKKCMEYEVKVQDQEEGRPKRTWREVYERTVKHAREHRGCH